MANTGRISQSAIEVFTTQSGGARITQNAIEFVTGVGISCGNPPAGIVGTSYTHTFPTGGGTPPYTIVVSSGTLPPGLALNPSTGVLAGVPTTVGVFGFTLQITDLVATVASVSCSITVTSVNTKNIAITLVGWKLYPVDACKTEAEEVAPVPPVDRAV